MQSPGYFNFFSQHKVISGNKALEHLPTELYSLNAVKPLVIIGKKSFARGLSKVFVKAMYDTNLVIGGIFSEVPEKATMALIDDLAILFRARGCDSIIGIGGDAVMNLAKGLNIKISENCESILELKGDDQLTKPARPLVYIPTSHGDGLEASNMAVIDHNEFRSDFLYPDIVCLDSRITRGCCRECVVDTAMVALTQAVESSAEPNHSPHNDAYTYPAIQFLSDHLENAVKKPQSPKASLGVANAAAIAAISFSNAPIGIVYAIGEVMADLTAIPRGVCMGVLLPHRLEMKLKNKEKIRDELFLALSGFDTYAATPVKERSRAAIDCIKTIQARMKGIVPSKLRDLGLPRYRLKEIAERVTELHDKSFKLKDCLDLLETAYGA
jgi:alcohol dehydrogenase